MMFAQSMVFGKLKHTYLLGIWKVLLMDLFPPLPSFAVRVGEEHERNSPSDGDEEESGEGVG